MPIKAGLTEGDLEDKLLMRLADNTDRSGVFCYIDYQPRGVPGFESDIANKIGVSGSYTERLLNVIDAMVDSGKVDVPVEPYVIDGSQLGSTSTAPKKIRKTLRLR